MHVLPPSPPPPSPAAAATPSARACVHPWAGYIRARAPLGEVHVPQCLDVFFHDVPPNRLLSSPGVMKSFCVMPLVASAACECTGRQLGVIELRRAIVPSVQPGIRLHKGTIALRDDPLPSPQRACARSYVNVRAGACCGGGGYAPRPPPPAPSFPPNPRARTCTRAHASLPPHSHRAPCAHARARAGGCMRAGTHARPPNLSPHQRARAHARLDGSACVLVCVLACVLAHASSATSGAALLRALRAPPP